LESICQVEIKMITEIEELLDLNDFEIRALYDNWDRRDGGKVGLIEILLFQEIEKHKREYGIHYDRNIDDIKLRMH